MKRLIGNTKKEKVIWITLSGDDQQSVGVRRFEDFYWKIKEREREILGNDATSEDGKQRQGEILTQTNCLPRREAGCDKRNLSF